MRKLVILLVMSIFILAACSSDSSSSEPVSSLDDGVLTVGLECDYAPYNWTTTEENKTEAGVLISGSDNAYCNGYDVMIAQEVANYLGVELEVKKIAWDGLIPALESGQIDAIIAGMSPTAERKETISFTNAYYADDIEQGIVVSASSPLASATTLEDFIGASISAQLGTLQESLVTQIPEVEQVASMSDYATLQQAVLSGQIDGFIAEEVIGLETQASNNDLVYVPIDEFVLDEGMTTSAIGVRKDDTELQAQLNEALDTISVETREEWMLQASEEAGL